METSSLLFWRRYLRRPLGIGALAPSSASLARAMVRVLDPKPTDTVVELGPGTGVFTRQLLDHGMSPEKLILVELDGDFVRHLRMRFKGVTVVEGDARQLPHILQSRGDGQVPRILSGLPLRSMAAPMRAEIGRAMAGSLAPGGRLVQFTYFNAPPLPEATPGELSVERASVVLRNLPPAFVWRYVKGANVRDPWAA